MNLLLIQKVRLRVCKRQVVTSGGRLDHGLDRTAGYILVDVVYG